MTIPPMAKLAGVEGAGGHVQLRSRVITDEHGALLVAVVEAHAEVRHALGLRERSVDTN